MPARLTRRNLVSGLAAAGVAGVITTRRVRAAEEPLETTTMRLGRIPATCDAPIYAADDLLRAEGLTDVRFMDTIPGPARIEALGRGEFDFTMTSALTQINALDSGVPITIVAGLHAGCYELFARDGVRGITELKGKRVGLVSVSPALLIMMAAAAFKMARTTRLVATGLLRTNSRLSASMQQKYCDQGRSKAVLTMTWPAWRARSS